MEAREIESTITKARELASLSDYDGALELYSSMDQEIDNQTHLTTGLIKSRWEALRTELGSEVQLIREVQAQLHLFVSPADAARVDYPRRVKTTIDDCAREAPRYGGVATRGTKPYVRTRSAVHDTVPSEPDVGKINQVLYGDKDKFGPDVPNTAPQRGRWWPNGGQRANPAPAAHPKPARRISHIHNSETNTTVSQLNGGSSNQASARVRADRVKPPVPQFQRRDGPSQPSAPANRKNTNAGKFVKNPAVEGLPGRAPFVPRAGDEELTSIIQADILLGNLNVRWDDVAGLDEAKESLKEAMVLPLLLPDFFQGCRQPHKGILMYGPPGTGKTMLAKAASTQCETTFFNVSPTTLASKWRGDSERMVRVLFEMARHYAPSTIFIDEIDALCSQRTSSEHEATRRMKTEILTQIDGVQSISGSGTDQKLVIVLGATNMPWEIDEGFLRRLSKRIYIPLPNLSSRAELLKITTKGINVGEDVHFEELAKHMENYSGSDIAAICKEASLMALRRLSEGLRVEDIKQRATELQKELCQLPLSQADFSTAMKRVRSSVNHTHIVKYEKWTQEFGCM